MQTFPRTQVEGISLPRMIAGTNWVLGYSHTSPAADALIRCRYAQAQDVARLMEAYLAHGIDAVMGPFEPDGALLLGVRMAGERAGRPMTIIDTPIVDVTDSAAGRAAARARIERSAKMGASICLLHHSCVEQLVNKHRGAIERLPDYLDMIRQAGLVPGLSAHMP